MNIALTEEWERYVRERVASGASATAEEAVAEALALLKSRDELRGEIETGLREADAGEFEEFTAEDVIREGRGRLEARKRAV